jgi:2-C-methyl-D-erythritol 4-phosphate cytidylyltransferase
MGTAVPKQFQLLRSKALALHSFELVCSLEEVSEIVVVCDPSYQSLFSTPHKPVLFALPGARRQDSVYQGLLASSPEAQLICIHDAARPFLEKETILTLFEKALDSGAAGLASPAVNTIKQADASQKVVKTLPRNELWEIQTPQAIRRDLLLKAYAHAHSNDIEATDDLSLVEAMGAPTVLVKSSSRNFKITTPFDWAVAETLCAAALN